MTPGRPRSASGRRKVAAGARARAARAAALAAALLVLASSASAAEATPGRDPAHEHGANALVFFLHGEAHHLDASGATTRALNEDAWIAADVVLALTRDRFRLFGEYLLSPQEQDIERLQLGYEPAADTIVWLGRFHQPASAWNVEHHHGRYLQTAVTRPAIELWEDEEGVLPQHLTGLLVESRRPLGDAAALQFAVGAGLAPRIRDEGLDPLDLLDPRLRDRRWSWTGRLAYLPEYTGASGFGVLLGSHRMPVTDAAAAARLGAIEVKQNVYGAYGDWRRDPWRIVLAVYDVHLVLRGAGPARKERFAAGYLQAEHQLPRGFTVYGRAEISDQAAQSTYVGANHPDFELRRATAGLRWDFRPRQALTVEAGHGERLRGSLSELRLQWSAALP